MSCQVFDGNEVEIEAEAARRHHGQGVVPAVEGGATDAEYGDALTVSQSFRVDRSRSFVVENRNQVGDRRHYHLAEPGDKVLVLDIDPERRRVVVKRLDQRFADVVSADDGA